MANLSNINNKFLVTTGGNVLIGQTSAVGSSIFQVSGEALFGNGTNGLLLSYSNGNSSGIIDTGHSSTALEFRVGNTQELLINGSSATFAGDVGIGETSPSAKLHIKGNSDSSSEFLIIEDSDSTAGSITPKIQFKSASAAIGSIRAHDTRGLQLGGGTNTQDLTIDPSGNVGIGTYSPGRELTVEGAGNVYIKIQSRTDNDSTALELQNTQHIWTIANDDTNNDALEFRSGGVGTPMVIEKGGNIGS